MNIEMGRDAGSSLDVRLAVPEWLAWTESLLLLCLCLVLPALAHPENPFYVNEGFPWPMLGPVLLGLRYGFAHGFSGALLVVASIGLALQMGWWRAAEFPLTYAVGTIVTAMLAGEFRDVWQRRLNRLQAANSYRSERLEEFTRSFHLLRISHDQLEQQLAGSGYSLREALTRLQTEQQSPMASSDNSFNAERAGRLLRLLAEYGSLQSAGIYALDGKTLSTEPLAFVGAMPALKSDDALVRRCLNEGTSIALSADAASVELARHSPLLACLPIADSRGHLHAVLCIHALPFFALQGEVLRVLSLLCAHGCDQIVSAANLDGVQQFDRQLALAKTDQARFDLAACVLQLSAPLDAEHQRLFAHYKSQKRALDIWLESSADNRLQVKILMPLTDSTGAHTWLARLGLTASVMVEVVTVAALAGSQG